MLKGIFIILVIIILLAISHQGIEKVKTKPIQSSVDTTKTIYGYIKSAMTNQTEIGMIPCINDNDCIVLEQCKDGNCVCQKGSCFR